MYRSVCISLFLLLLVFDAACVSAETQTSAPAEKTADPGGPALTKPKTDSGEEKPKLSEVALLKEKAQQAFLRGSYEESAAYDLKIAQKYPGSKERHYAVQMLGTIYECNAVDLKNAIKWNREFLKKYADPRQVPVYQEKVDRLVALDKKQGEEEAYKGYQKIKFANKGDQYLVKQYESLIKQYPGFSLKGEVEKEIAYAYQRLNRPRESYLAFQAVSSMGRQRLSPADKIEAQAEQKYWEMSTTWKWVALAIVAALWGALAWVRPWGRVDRRVVRNFSLWALGWIALMASRMPTFYKMETSGYQFVIQDTEIYLLAALNLPVILWLMLFARGEYWVSRPRALRWVGPSLTLVMTVAVIYLFIAFHPNGPAIVSVFGVKYDYLIGELRTKGTL